MSNDGSGCHWSPSDGHSYVPILDVLQLLDLAYSESGSAGYLRIFAGRNVVELNRNRVRVRLNQSSIGLAAPVLFRQGRWLAPRGFVPDVLNRVLKPAIRVSPSGNRWLTGGRDFVRINLTTRTTEDASRLVIALVNAGEIQVRGEEGRILFLLGRHPVDPPGAEVTSFQDERIGGVSFEETAESSRLVVSLADESGPVPRDPGVHSKCLPVGRLPANRRGPVNRSGFEAVLPIGTPGPRPTVGGESPSIPDTGAPTGAWWSGKVSSKRM